MNSESAKQQTMAQQQLLETPTHGVVDPSEQARIALKQLEQHDNGELRTRGIVAAIGATALGAGVWAVASGTASKLRFSKTMPYLESAQHVVNDVQGVLSTTGEVSLGAGAAIIVGVKVGSIVHSKYRTKLEVVDQWSSREMSEDRLNPKRSPAKKVLEAGFAGRVPVMAAIGAGLAVFAAGISTEVSQGPERPINHVMDTMVPGDEMVVNYAGTMPMVESTVSRSLADDVLRIAAQRHVQAAILDENLGQLTKGTQNLTDLSLGVSVPRTSPLSFDGAGFFDGATCASIPIAIDRSAGVGIGQSVELNGVPAHVVQEVDGISATNRVGIEMDAQAMADCLKKDPNAPVHSVVLNTTAENAQSILAAADTNGEVSTVITKQHYLSNSESFWNSNVKPITSVLALFAGIFASAVAGSRMRESLVRHRREWSAKSVSGNGDGIIRATEFLRVIKDGVLATFIGGAGAMFATPIVVNTLESGFQASIGVRELMVGSSVAIGGSLLGALKSLINPRKIIRPEESIRG